MKKRALISVSDKTGIVEFSKKIVNYDYEIVSTGGTYQALKEAGVPAINISDITGFPEIMDGRVKTLHPAIHGGLLAVRDNKEHMQAIEKLGINTIDMVVVNLYPFKETIRKLDVTLENAIENIDIGGPSMLRSAAKNYKHVVVVVDPTDYKKVLAELENGQVTEGTKSALGAKVFRHTAAYDTLIANYLSKEEFPEKLTLTYEKKQDLRYGENPHQTAAFYTDSMSTNGIGYSNQLHGKELSYNNINDADTAISMASEFDKPTAVAVKHANPCGVGTASTIEEAYQKAFDSDPISIFGGIVALNRPVGEKLAKTLSETFLEIIISPSFDQKALDILTQKKNIRLLTLDMKKHKSQKYITSVAGGVLVQDEDNINNINISVPTKIKPTEEQLQEALFAQTIVKYVKSNAIALTKNGATIGIGPGQTNRVGAAKIALEVAGEKTQGSTMASDAFFPMRDTVDLAVQAGVSVIVQPGGSIKDQESIDACDEAGIAMVITGTRHFRH